MVIYEVNLKIKEIIFSEFIVWLESHVKDILKIPGFKAAKIAEEKLEPTKDKKITVTYEVESMPHLDKYLEEYAGKYRADGLNRFGDNFSATRRIFLVSKMF